MTKRTGWRANLALFLYFPGLISLAVIMEKLYLEPRVTARSPVQDVSFWDRFVARNRDFAPSYLRVGLAKTATGDLEGARRAYARALELDPEFEAAALGLNGVLRSQGGPAASIAQLESFYRENPDCLVCPQNLAADHLTLNQPARARHYIDELLARPGYQLSSVYGRRDHRLDALVLAGRIYAANDLRGQARQFFQQALVRNPQDRAATFQLGMLALAGEPREAVAHWQRYLGLAPGDPRGRIHLAEAHIAAGQPREARRELGEAQAALRNLDPAAREHWRGEIARLLEASQAAPQP